MKINVFLYTAKAESCQRVTKESRSSDSHGKCTARGVWRHGRFTGTSLERCERCTSNEKLFITTERQIPPVKILEYL